MWQEGIIKLLNLSKKGVALLKTIFSPGGGFVLNSTNKKTASLVSVSSITDTPLIYVLNAHYYGIQSGYSILGGSVKVLTNEE